jgi:phosphoribosyl-AMP cyclohydrolase
MVNFKTLIESSHKKCKVDVFYINRAIGNTVQNSFKISSQQDDLKIIETIAPYIVIEKFSGKNYNFACALAIDLIDHFGSIQLSWIEKPNGIRSSSYNLFELTVYYSKTNAIDETTKNQMMFYHSQQNLDLQYLTQTEITELAKLYLDCDTCN